MHPLLIALLFPYVLGFGKNTQIKRSQVACEKLSALIYSQFVICIIVTRAARTFELVNDRLFSFRSYCFFFESLGDALAVGAQFADGASATAQPDRGAVYGAY